MKTNSYRVRKIGSGNSGRLNAQKGSKSSVEPWCFIMVTASENLHVVAASDMPSFRFTDAIDADGLVGVSQQGPSSKSHRSREPR